MYVCIYLSIYVSMYLCIYVSMYACMHVCMYACMHVCMYACMHVCMYACMYVCVCMYVCIFWKPTYTWTSHSCHWLAILDDAEAWAPGGLCLGVGDGIAQWSKASQKREHESQRWSDFSD